MIVTTKAAINYRKMVNDNPKSQLLEAAHAYERALAAIADENLVLIESQANACKTWIARGECPNVYAQTLETLRAGYARLVRQMSGPDEVAQPAKPAAPAPAARPDSYEVPKPGYYTVVLSDGTHVTLRVKPHWTDELKDSTVVVGYLAGQDNTGDYIQFGDVSASKARVWRKFDGQLQRQREALAYLVAATVEEKATYGVAYAAESGNCYRCGRVLTTPESIKLGIGPKCAGME